MTRCMSSYLQEQLSSVREEVRTHVDALQGGLRRRQEVAAARQLLELMQDTAHVMSKVRAPPLIMLVTRLSPADGKNSK